MGIRVRACIKCKKYLTIKSIDPINLSHIKFFDTMHRGHTLITVELNEVKEVYEKVKFPVAVEISL